MGFLEHLSQGTDHCRIKQQETRQEGRLGRREALATLQDIPEEGYIENLHKITPRHSLSNNKPSSRHITCVMFNARSLRSKFDEFQCHVALERPDIICIQKHGLVRVLMETYWGISSYKGITCFHTVENPDREAE